MTPFHQQVMRHAQAEAINRSAWRGPLAPLARLIAASMGTERTAEVETALRCPELQQALFQCDVALWLGTWDGQARLVDQQPGSLGAARLRLEHKPGPGVCRYCLLREPNPVGELEADTDGYDRLVSGSFIHTHCRRAWRRLQAQVARVEEVSV